MDRRSSHLPVLTLMLFSCRATPSSHEKPCDDSGRGFIFPSFLCFQPRGLLVWYRRAEETSCIQGTVIIFACFRRSYGIVSIRQPRTLKLPNHVISQRFNEKFHPFLPPPPLHSLLLKKAIFLSFIILALFMWALVTSNNHDMIFRAPISGSSLSPLAASISINSVIGCWSTLALNIPDFTRYAKSDRAQALGQSLGLPLSMMIFSFFSLVIARAVQQQYGSVIPASELWDPVALVGVIKSPVLQGFAYICIVLAQLATNITANLVAPANDFSNLAPQYISFFGGGVITVVIGVAICPWKLVADSSAFIYTWLSGYASLLGPIVGVMLCDYFYLRSKELDAVGLYSRDGPYWYRSGFNTLAFLAVLIGFMPNIPGFLAYTIGNEVPVFKRIPKWAGYLYDFSWLLGLVVAYLCYQVLVLWTDRTGRGKSQDVELLEIETVGFKKSDPVHDIIEAPAVR